MSVTLSNHLTPAGDAGYYTEKWINVVKRHRDYLLALDDTSVIRLEGNLAYRFRNDLFSLFKFQKLPEQTHVAIMVVNGFENPQNFDENVTQIIYPSNGAISELFRKTMN